MVWNCMTTAGTGELRFIEGNMDSNMYCDILKQKMMPSLQKRFPTLPPQTHRQDDNCLAAECEGDGVAKYVSRPRHWAGMRFSRYDGMRFSRYDNLRER